MLKMGGIDPEKLYRATLSWACGRLSPWKSSKRQIADLKGPNLLRKLERPENNKKKNNLPFDLKNGQLIVWLCHALNCLPWQSCQSPVRVCQRYMKSLFNTRLLCGETGRFTRRTRNRWSNARRFFSRSSPFFLVYFALFSAVSFFLFFFQK